MYPSFNQQGDQLPMSDAVKDVFQKAIGQAMAVVAATITLPDRDLLQLRELRKL